MNDKPVTFADALREALEAARAFIPTCEETTYDDASERSSSCGKLATHMDRCNGHETSRLCDEHASLARAAAEKAASKGYSRALELDMPRPLEEDHRVTRLHAALAQVARATERTAVVQGEHRLPRGTPGHLPGRISWVEHEEAWQGYARRYGSSQSAERIHERGGFGYHELTLLLGHEPISWRPR